MGSGTGRRRRRDERLSRPPGLWSALALAAVALGPGVGLADPPAKAADPDEELLEFLGTVDSTADANTQPDDESWIDYLSQTDIDAAGQGRAAQGKAAGDKAANKPDAPGPSGAKEPSAPGPDAKGPDAKAGAPKVKSDDQ